MFHYLGERSLWKRLHELLSQGHHALLLKHKYKVEVTDLTNFFRFRVFLSADSAFLDLVWELCSLFYARFDEFEHNVREIWNLEPTVVEADALHLQIEEESSRLQNSKEKYAQA